jgi:hypothetical protein
MDVISGEMAGASIYGKWEKDKRKYCYKICNLGKPFYFYQDSKLKEGLG